MLESSTSLSGRQCFGSGNQKMCLLGCLPAGRRGLTSMTAYRAYACRLQTPISSRHALLDSALLPQFNSSGVVQFVVASRSVCLSDVLVAKRSNSSTGVASVGGCKHLSLGGCATPLPHLIQNALPLVLPATSTRNCPLHNCRDLNICPTSCPGGVHPCPTENS